MNATAVLGIVLVTFVNSPRSSTPLGVTEITIAYHYRGCGGSGTLREVLVRDDANGVFVSDDRSIAIASLDDVASSLRRTSSLPRDLMVQAGIDEYVFDAHRTDILKAALPRAWREAPPLDEETLSSILDWSKVEGFVRAEMLGRNRRGTGSVEVSIRFDGDDPISLSARALGPTPRHVVWNIERSGETWQVIHSSLPRDLRLLASPDDIADVEGFLGPEYWTTRFWTDEDAWSRLVGRELDSVYSVRALSGSQDEAAKAAFSASNVRTHVAELSADLACTDTSIVDVVHLEATVRRGGIEIDWKAISGFVKAADSALSRKPWLNQWASSAGRTVELNAYADEKARDFEEVLDSGAWKRAGLMGDAEFCFGLSDASGYRATGFASSQEMRVVLVLVYPSDGDHWLDELDFLYHPLGGAYAVVDAHGDVAVIQCP